ncbi:MAG: DUF1799 domain-containing protein [Chloroflexi bacterium]|nr:DUF1799 domain-containing protein [Chloroflexota bacterium]
MRDAVGLFMALQTQWKWIGAGMAGAFRSGIDYPAIAPTAAALDVKLTADLFNDIRLLERESLRVWNARR